MTTTEASRRQDDTIEDLRVGDVVQYASERPNSWCREGMAIADSNGRLFDTYWNCGGDRHLLTESEAATAQMLFNLEDFSELDRRDVQTWESYHPDDRQVVTSQHGLVRRIFVRLGAQPDFDTKIANAREAVADAEEKVLSAQRTLESRRRALAELETRARD